MKYKHQCTYIHCHNYIHGDTNDYYCFEHFKLSGPGQRNNSNPSSKEIARHHLQAVLDGHYTLYNNVSKEYVEVTKDTIEGMIEMYSQLSEGHGIEHLIFIKGEHSPISFNTSPTITGDSDTDELLEDERLAQIEGQAIDQMMNISRGK